MPSVGLDDDFRGFDLWDSLTAFALRVMIDQRCGRRLSGADIESCRTVADLMKAAGVAQ